MSERSLRLLSVHSAFQNLNNAENAEVAELTDATDELLVETLLATSPEPRRRYGSYQGAPSGAPLTGSKFKAPMRRNRRKPVPQRRRQDTSRLHRHT